jgi:hypothetical protein
MNTRLQVEHPSPRRYRARPRRYSCGSRRGGVAGPPTGPRSARTPSRRGSTRGPRAGFCRGPGRYMGGGFRHPKSPGSTPGCGKAISSPRSTTR